MSSATHGACSPARNPGLNECLALHTGQPLAQIEKDTDRDNFMGAEEARQYGLIDAVLEKRI